MPLKAYISEMRVDIETVVVAWSLLFDFALFSMSFKFFFCNLNFWILTPASEITLQFFSGTPFRSWTFWTYIVTTKYELYQNLGPLRSILRALEHKMPGGAESAPPVQSTVKSINLKSTWYSRLSNRGEYDRRVEQGGTSKSDSFTFSYSAPQWSRVRLGFNSWIFKCQHVYYKGGH